MPKLADAIPDDETEARLDEAARLEITSGKGVSHDRVRTWLGKLANGVDEPPPSA